ncbi:MAG: hypothetical protein RJA44_1227, partial [Pseudomonadota bacterium]
MTNAGSLAPVLRWLATGSAALALVGCGSFRNPAPVEERLTAPRSTSAETPSSRSSASLGLENAGKAGYFTVRPGDTLIRIGLETGQNWRDLQRWNSIDNPNLIEVGQVLRVVPPGHDLSSNSTTRPVTSSRVEARPLDTKPASSSAGSSTSAAAATAAAAAPAQPPLPQPALAAAPAPAASPSPSPTPAASSGGDDDMNWVWPAQGALVSSFDEARNKGVSIAGKAGDPVLAAADGKVVYAGSGLRGYGNLIIIKHNETYLTAYAHNQALLVKEDQPVRRGQKIAEMG